MVKCPGTSGGGATCCDEERRRALEFAARVPRAPSRVPIETTEEAVL